jgi:hypothetical protein
MASSWGVSWGQSWGTSWDRAVSPIIPLKVFLFGMIEKETSILGESPTFSNLSGDSGKTQYMKGKTVPQ